MWKDVSDGKAHHVIAKKAVEKKIAKKDMVASEHPLASRAGLMMLEQGGNAVDAAVATHFALAVVKPYSTGIGGGGRCVIRLNDSETFAMNFEPMTPAKENPFEPDLDRIRTIYKVSLGRPAAKNDENILGYKAAAIPGFVKGMDILLEKLGNLDLATILEPAIDYAENGYLICEHVAKTIAFNMNLISQFPETAKILLKNGLPPRPWGSARWGTEFDKLVQKDLAETLKKISQDGPEAFYSGEIAEKIALDMEANGGYITENDLKSYEPEYYEVSEWNYRGYQMHSLPVSTGINQILEIIENFDMKKLGYNDPRAIHVLVEAVKMAYAAREEYLALGLEKRPFYGIATQEYADTLAKQIKIDKIIENIDLGDPWKYEEQHTTHACVVDKDRNIAGVHSSLGDNFGSKVVIKGTGIILNNKMKDYDPRKNAPNSVRPHTIRPPPSGSVIILKNDKPFMVIGSPGGYKQPPAISRCISNVIDYGMGIQESMDAARIFVQSGKVFLESTMPSNVIEYLQKVGHDVTVVDREFGFALPTGIKIDQKTGDLYGGVNGLPAVTLGH
jgi:gamma-glutamyltranspeptidase/glutathione hydrolase